MKVDPPTEVRNFLASTVLFSGLDADLVELIASTLRAFRVKSGDVIIREGDTGDSLFILMSGELQVAIRLPTGTQRPVADLTSGSFVGEGALLTGDHRSASVIAITDATLLELSRSAFERLMEGSRGDLEPLLQRLTERVWQRQLSSALHRSALFARLELAVFQDLQTELKPLTVNSGQVLFREGDAANDLFILISGRLCATHQDAHGERVLVELASGDTVGEMAVLGGAKRTATVFAMRDSNVAKLSTAGFDRILRRHPTVAAPLFTRRLATLLQEQTSKRPTRTTIRTIAVVPGNAEFDFEQFCRELTEVLSVHARVLHLSSERIRSWLGPTSLSRTVTADPYHSRLVEWLNTKETEYDYILYQSDAADTPWTRQCLRQADEVLEVCGALSVPQPGPLPQILLGDDTGRAKCRISLVLVHRGLEQPFSKRRTNHILGGARILC